MVGWLGSPSCPDVRIFFYPGSLKQLAILSQCGWRHSEWPQLPACMVWLLPTSAVFELIARSNSKLNFHKAITHIFSKNLACWQVYNMAPCVRRSMSWQTLLGMPGAVSKRYGKPSWNKTKDVRIWKSWWLVAGIAKRMFGLMIFAYHMPLLLYTFVTFLAGFWKEHLQQQLLSNLNLSLVADPCTIQFVLGHSVNLSHSLGEHIVDEEQRQLQGPMERPWEATEDPEAKIVYHLDDNYAAAYLLQSCSVLHMCFYQFLSWNV